LRLKRTSLLAVAALIAVIAIPATAAARTNLIGSGSSAEQPIMQLLFKAYSKVVKGTTFSFNADGGNAGVADVQAGRSQFAINTRPPLPSDTHTTQYKIFLDGLCVAVNNSNSLTNLPLGTIKNIFLGLNTNWSQIAGANLTATIDPIGRNAAAGSYTFFQSAALGGKTQASNVAQETSDGLVEQTIKQDPNSIGYVGLAHSGKGSGIKALEINNIACDQANIKNETYPLFRYIWAVLPQSHPSVAVEKFIDWIRTSVTAGKVINEAGAVAAFNKK
jgi:phosphate transport system substrate-binding protein